MYQSGNGYEGDWVDNQRVGKGKMVWTDGAVYEGDWVNDVREGTQQWYNNDDHPQEKVLCGGKTVEYTRVIGRTTDVVEWGRNPTQMVMSTLDNGNLERDMYVNFHFN